MTHVELPLNALNVVRRLPLRQQLRDTEKIRISSLIILVLVIVFLSVLSFVGFGLFIYGLLGGVGGLLGHWRATARAVVRFDSKRLSALELQNILERLHYVAEDITCRRFKPNLPKWLVYRSQTLQLDEESGQWIIYGPYAALRVLRKRVYKWLAL